MGLCNSSKLTGKSGNGLTRRRFVQGIIAGGVLGSLEFCGLRGIAADHQAPLPLLWGNKFNLAVKRVPVNFTGRPNYATAVNGSVPGPILRWREGDDATIAVTNRLAETTSIHWHGIRTPSDMDGVPGLSFSGIKPGETFIYRFPIRQNGTYWYHSHSHFQEQTGHYGALIIDPLDRHRIEYDRDYVVVLSEWTDENPETILSNLKQQSDYFNYNQRTIGTFVSNVKSEGFGSTMSDRLMWGRMNMSPTDILDVSGHTYTYLMNGQPPNANWTALSHPGERVRLRLINASSMTIFDVRIPGLPLMVVQADGNDVEPIEVDELRISVAETYDVIVQPPDARPYTIFAQAEDRTGYARGTLAPGYGMAAAIPPMDPRPLRTMVDMGKRGMHDMKAMDMADMQPSKETTAINMPGANVGVSPKYARRALLVGPEAPGQPGPRTSIAYTEPDMGAMPAPRSIKVGLRLGPEVDNVAAMPSARLSSPGEGFPAGRRVLTYADLRAVYRGTDPRPPQREIELHLTGNMERYIWGFDGKKFSSAEPIQLKLGERVRFILVNDTMMEHPIHLHGLWSELENGNGEFRPYKHTINVKPAERLSFLVSADTPGQWAFHCHLLYHMESGMFRAVMVS